MSNNTGHYKSKKILEIQIKILKNIYKDLIFLHSYKLLIYIINIYALIIYLNLFRNMMIKIIKLE